jgi:hypothetical protein
MRITQFLPVGRCASRNPFLKMCGMAVKRYGAGCVRKKFCFAIECDHYHSSCWAILAACEVGSNAEEAVMPAIFPFLIALHLP